MRLTPSSTDSTFKFPLASPSHASIIRRALQVDKPRNPKEASTLIDDVEGGLQMYVFLGMPATAQALAPGLFLLLP